MEIALTLLKIVYHLVVLVVHFVGLLATYVLGVGFLLAVAGEPLFGTKTTLRLGFEPTGKPGWVPALYRTLSRWVRSIGAPRCRVSFQIHDPSPYGNEPRQQIIRVPRGEYALNAFGEWFTRNYPNALHGYTSTTYERVK